MKKVVQGVIFFNILKFALQKKSATYSKAVFDHIFSEKKFDLSIYKALSIANHELAKDYESPVRIFIKLDLSDFLCK
jgi:hypothetical protein